MLIKGVHHVALKAGSVEKFEECVRFYHEILGMEIVRRWGEGSKAGIMLNTGDGALMEVFAEGAVSEKTGSVNHFALATEDVDACVKAVRDAGYAITMEPKNINIPADLPLAARIAFCVGPLGEEIEFFDEK